MALPARELLLKLGEARERYRAAWRLLDVRLPEPPAARGSKAPATFGYRLNRAKLRKARLREAEGHVVAAVEVLRAGDDLPVVFLGGLGPTYDARLAQDWPQRPALGSGLDGALAMAQALALTEA